MIQWIRDTGQITMTGTKAATNVIIEPTVTGFWYRHNGVLTYNDTNSGTIDLSTVNDLSIENAQFFTDLDVVDESLKTIDIAEAKELIFLDCHQNQLITLDVTNNPNLIEFNCSINQISELDITNNVKLKILWIYDNNISNVDVTQNPLLTSFHIGENNISNVDVTQNPLLESFYCNDNNLSSLDVTQNILLKNLNLHRNNISNLNITQNTQLETLLIYANPISSINLSQNVNLKELRAQGCYLTSIDLSQNINLEFLKLENNNISTLDISNNPLLKDLNISKTGGMQISPTNTDQILNQLDVFGLLNGTFQFDERTTASDAAIASLQSKGWTVTGNVIGGVSESIRFNGTSAYMEVNNTTDWHMGLGDKLTIVFEPEATNNYDLMGIATMGSGLSLGFEVNNISNSKGVLLFDGTTPATNLRQSGAFPMSENTYSVEYVDVDANNFKVIQSFNGTTVENTINKDQLHDNANPFVVGVGNGSADRYFTGKVKSLQFNSDILDLSGLTTNPTTLTSSGGTVFNFYNTTLETV